MRSLFFNFTNILFCLIFAISLSAQTGNPSDDVPITTLGTIHNEGDGIHIPIEYCLNSNNDLIVKTNIILGGLQLEGSSPDFYGVIPSGYPDMYIEYTINGISYPPSQVGNFDIIELPNGFPAYSYIAQSPTIDFSNECGQRTEGSTYIFTVVSFRLVTPNGTGWDIYPACNYTQSWGMFSCNIYDFAPWCGAAASEGLGAPDVPGQNCYDEWYSGGFSAYLYCDCDNGPTHDDEPVDDGGNIIKEDGSSNRDIKSLETKVYPNPMGNILYIESNDQINKIEVFDARGKVLMSNNYTGKIRNVSLDTSHLPHGLYLVRIAKNSGTTITKVLK